jgi:hypothetical protein
MTTQKTCWGIAVYPHEAIKPIVRIVPNRAIAEMMAANIRRLTKLTVEVIFCVATTSP